MVTWWGRTQGWPWITAGRECHFIDIALGDALDHPTSLERELIWDIYGHLSKMGSDVEYLLWPQAQQLWQALCFVPQNFFYYGIIEELFPDKERWSYKARRFQQLRGGLQWMSRCTVHISSRGDLFPKELISLAVGGTASWGLTAESLPKKWKSFLAWDVAPYWGQLASFQENLTGHFIPAFPEGLA